MGDLSGNKIQYLPDGIMNTNSLKYLYSARNLLNSTGLPDDMGSGMALVLLDLRNNSLMHIPPWLFTVEYTYLHENPFCQHSEGKRFKAMCAAQCSQYCVSADLENNGCDTGCNSMECNFDN